MSEASKRETKKTGRTVINIPKGLHTELRVLAANRRKGESISGLVVEAVRKVYRISCDPTGVTEGKR